MSLIKIEKKPGSTLKYAVFIPFIIIVFVIPIVTLHIHVTHNEEMRQVFIKTQGYDDYFHLVKVLFLYLSVLLLFAVFLIKKNNEALFPRVFLFFIPYCVLTIFSMYFSNYRISAVFGIIDHYEGGLTQLSYCFIAVFSYYLISVEKDIITIIKFMLTASVAVAAAGIFQYVGILPVELPYTVSSLIGNSNYVGTYAVLLLPNALALLLLETGYIKRLVQILVYIGSAVFLLFGSMSRTGYIGFIVIILLFTVFLRKEILKNYRWFLVAAVYAGIIFVLMNAVSKGLLIDEWRSINPFSAERHDSRLRFEDIRLTDTEAVIKTNRWFLEIQNRGDGFNFFNEYGEPVLYEKNPGDEIIQFVNEPYSNIMGLTKRREDFEWLILNMEGKDIEFVKTDEYFKIVGYNGLVTDIEPVESFGFEGLESFASGRGYIWSRALPLLKNSIWIGYGPDTFTYFFPQNDIVGKLNYGAIWIIIGKPHNWYLQTALGSGILSLLLILSILMFYMVKATKFLLKADKSGLLYEGEFIHKHSNTKIICCGILLSVTGYCITGLFNDSVVAVSPIFWMLLGFGLRIVVTGFDSALSMVSTDHI